MKPLELLSNINVASPCPASWDDMIGDDRVRFCNQCEKNVYNLSALTTAAATALILEKEGNLCGRFFRRADGTVLTADCPVGVQHRLRRKRRLAVLATSLAGFLTLGGCTKIEETSTSTPTETGGSNEVVPQAVQGEIAPLPRAGMPKDERCVLGKIDMPMKKPAPPVEAPIGDRPATKD